MIQRYTPDLPLLYLSNVFFIYLQKTTTGIVERENIFSINKNTITE